MTKTECNANRSEKRLGILGETKRRQEIRIAVLRGELDIGTGALVGFLIIEQPIIGEAWIESASLNFAPVADVRELFTWLPGFRYLGIRQSKLKVAC